MKAEEALGFDSEHRLRSENLCFDIDTWYPKLKAFTFDSLFLPLTRREAECILAFHDVSWRNSRQRPHLTREEVAILQNLEQAIDEEIQLLFQKNLKPTQNQEPAAFVRLCGRSPKDGEPYDRSGVYSTYQSKLTDLLSSGYPDIPNTQMIAIALTKFMKVRSGKDAMSLLLTSERVFAEMLDWTRFGEPEQICLRLWEEQLTLDYEFRAFCCKGRLTAITQYDHYTHYPYLFPDKEMLRRGVYDCWKSVHPHVNAMDSSYVIDIAYLVQSNRFILVELSPFTPCTGPALFHWQYDKTILEGKYLPSNIVAGTEIDYCSLLEFRLKELKDIHPELKDIIEMNWDMRWKEEKIAYDAYFTPTVEDIHEQDEKDKKATRWSRFQSSLDGFFGSSPRKEGLLVDAKEIAEKNEPEYYYLFVYGTLKRGFHWNTKYLHPRLGAKYLFPAKTVHRYALVIGDSGVPYLLGDVVGNPQQALTAGYVYSDRCTEVIGELWRINLTCLQGLDDYEGIGKGYYKRIFIPIVATSTAEGEALQPQVPVEAHVYILSQSSEELKEKEYLSEYSLELHQKYYKPIRHIQVKQCHYYQQPSTWGKTTELIEGTIDVPNH